MFRKITVLAGVVGMMLGMATARADVIFVSGNVSGTWSADTVIVTAEVRVPPGQTLTIMPGVEVLFWVSCKFIVDNNAILHAVGTVTDSIRFDEYLSGNRWKGIRFLSASSSSQLAYCQLKHGSATGSSPNNYGGAIYCYNSSPYIANCSIDSCTASSYGAGIYCGSNSNPIISNNSINGNSAGYGYGGGGGIYCDSSNPTISGNTISGNSTSDGGDGGGIYCTNSSPTISGNTISGNSTGSGGDGGGIYCYSSSPTISGNTISANSATYRGGGIRCDSSSSPTINSNTISGNSAFSGGGISCYSSSPTISGNTISANSVTYYGGGGILCQYWSSPTISGNTISGNSTSDGGDGGGIKCQEASSPTISGNTISGNSASNGAGVYCSSAPGAFELNEISVNNASGNGGGMYLSSVSFVMNKNTIVANTAAAGGGLYCTGYSPAVINSILWGNSPQQIYQASGPILQATYCDIQQLWPGVGNIISNPLFVNASLGDYHLQNGSPCIDAGDPNPIYNDPDGTRADMGCYYYNPSQTPVLEISADSLTFPVTIVGSSSNLPLTLYNTGGANLIISQIISSSMTFTTSYVPADSLILPGDSLNLTVSFSPDSVGVFSGSLSITSNGGNAEVVLSGEGISPVSIYLDPLFEPIFIYPWGGEVGYYLNLYNNTTSQQTFDVWVDILLPDSSVYGPVILRNNLVFAPSYHVTRLIVQSIPAAAPSGRYYMQGHVGDYQTQEIWSEDSFLFTKVNYNDGLNGLPVSGWTVSGWDDEIGMTASFHPSSFLLHPFRPNPFNPATVASYELRDASYVSLRVYDTAGRLVTTLMDGWREAGAHEVTFDPKGAGGAGLAAGVYIARLQAGEFTASQKLVLLK